MRWLLGCLALLLFASSAAAQVEVTPKVTLTVQVPPSSTLDPAESGLVPVTIIADLENIFCSGPSELKITLEVAGGSAKTITNTTEGEVFAAFTTGPLGDTPAGRTPGVANQATVHSNVTITAARTIPKTSTETLTVTAKYGGEIPANCQAAHNPPATAASTAHEVTIKASPSDSSRTTSTTNPSSSTTQDSPSVGLALGALLLSLAMLRRRV